MKNNKLLLILVIVIIMIPLLLVSCDTIEYTPLYAGRTSYVGEVAVANDVDYIYVVANLNQEAIDNGWVIVELHIDVKETLEELPVNKTGAPIIGKFTFKSSFEIEDEIIEYGDMFPIPETLYDNHFFIAVHVVIARYEEGSENILNESAWGVGTRFVEQGTWAMYLLYDLAEEE